MSPTREELLFGLTLTKPAAEWKKKLEATTTP